MAVSPLAIKAYSAASEVLNKPKDHDLGSGSTREATRSFAQTIEGRAWRDRLVKSRLVARGRFIWDAYNLDALLENEAGQLPTAWLDIIAAAVSDSRLETILSTLVVEEVKHGSLGAL